MNPEPSAPDDDAPAPAAPPDTFPWPPAAGATLDAAIETWRRSVFEPAAFFRALPTMSQLGPAVVYYLLLGVVVSGIGMFWRYALGPLVDPEHPLAAWLGAGEGNPLVTLLLTPVLLLAVLAVAAVTVHAVLWLAGGARHGLAHTAAVLAYAYSPQLFVVVPFAGSVVGAIWTVVLSVIGLRAAHATTTLRAAAAVFAPLIMLLVVFVILMLALAAVEGTLAAS